MKKHAFHIGWVAVSLAVALVSGCKGGDEQPVMSGDTAAAMVAAQNLPEGGAVMTALEQKDYPAAVAGLNKIQSSVTLENQDQFIILKQYVKGQLIDASATDPKAQEALDALRFMTSGR